MELKNLYIFRAIVKEGGFTQAARKLNYTPVSYTHLTLPTNSRV